MAYNRQSLGIQRTTPGVLNLIIINVLVFIAQSVFGGTDGESTLTNLFALHHYRASEFKIWQLVTHMFMHAGFLHILFNMFVLWMWGPEIERIFGTKKFLFFYFICGIGAGLLQMGVYAYTYHALDNAVLSQTGSYYYPMAGVVSLGASGAIMGVIAAFGYLFQDAPMMIVPIPFPIKAKWLILSIILLDVFSGIAGEPGDDVGHFAHVGGAVTGFLIVYFWKKRRTNKYYR